MTFPYPYSMSDEDRARYEREGREVAEREGPGYIFTDGLGAMGCGSWDDGPASVRQAAYARHLQTHRT